MVFIYRAPSDNLVVHLEKNLVVHLEKNLVVHLEKKMSSETGNSST